MNTPGNTTIRSCRFVIVNCKLNIFQSAIKQSSIINKVDILVEAILITSRFGVHNVDGASQVAKDCDAMPILNRHRIGEVDKGTFDTGAFIQSESTFGPEMLVTAGLSRYSAGGTTTVYFDGATSTVSSDRR